MKITLKLVPPRSRDRNFPFSFPLGSSRTKVGKHFTEELSWPSFVSPILMASLIFCSRTWIWSLFNIRSRMKSSINLENECQLSSVVCENNRDSKRIQPTFFSWSASWVCTSPTLLSSNLEAVHPCSSSVSPADRT